MYQRVETKRVDQDWNEAVAAVLVVLELVGGMDFLCLGEVSEVVFLGETGTPRSSAVAEEAKEEPITAGVEVEVVFEVKAFSVDSELRARSKS